MNIFSPDPENRDAARVLAELSAMPTEADGAQERETIVYRPRTRDNTFEPRRDERADDKRHVLSV